MFNIDNVSREIIDTLESYQSLLLKWNKAINLVSSSSKKDFWRRHILDSLQLMKYINDLNIHLVDIGTGGGLPGVILSIAGIKNVTLIESDVRKVAFLLQAAKICTNKINVVNQRIEEINLECEVLTCRAFSQLDKIFAHTQNIKVKNKYLLLKGKNYQNEIDKAQKKWSFYYLTYDSVTCSNSKILEINNLEKVND